MVVTEIEVRAGVSGEDDAEVGGNNVGQRFRASLGCRWHGYQVNQRMLSPRGVS